MTMLTIQTTFAQTFLGLTVLAIAMGIWLCFTTPEWFIDNDPDEAPRRQVVRSAVLRPGEPWCCGTCDRQWTAFDDDHLPTGYCPICDASPPIIHDPRVLRWAVDEDAYVAELGSPEYASLMTPALLDWKHRHMPPRFFVGPPLETPPIEWREPPRLSDELKQLLERGDEAA